jgi:hypothetical protein
MDSKKGGDLERYKEVVKERNYAAQAKFWLNAYWPEHSQDAENVWKWTHKFEEVDVTNGKDGHALNEFEAHRFLETLGETLTVVEMRQRLKEVDIDFDGKISLLDYLTWRFKRSIKELMSRPQGTNEELARAQKALDDVRAEIQKIEEKKKKLEEAANGTGTKAMLAKNELAQLLSAPTTELNRALLTAEAAVRKAQKLGGTAAQGDLWWMERELTEMKKYKPRGGVNKGSFQ